MNSGLADRVVQFADIFAGADSQDDAAGAFADLEMETDDADLLAGFGEPSPGADAESLRKTHVLPSGGDTELGTPEDDNAVVSTLVLDTGESSQIDEMQTKLDLARAYMDIGDTVGAKNLLGEVMAEGNDMQQHSARELLGEIA